MGESGAATVTLRSTAVPSWASKPKWGRRQKSRRRHSERRSAKSTGAHRHGAGSVGEASTSALHISVPSQVPAKVNVGRSGSSAPQRRAAALRESSSGKHFRRGSMSVVPCDPTTIPAVDDMSTHTSRGDGAAVSAVSSGSRGCDKRCRGEGASASPPANHGLLRKSGTT